ncbi:Ig-like domain-containing protein [Allosphingosinicella sp.]|uniref:Ig-like domain-containing protein n=1 Tax=Allosphingosinicella sp. TaxID=2823234 RepID=UPI002F133D3D
MNRKAAYLLSAAAGALALAGESRASETVTYSYDALGRLVGVSTSGGPNNGLTVGTGYDPAGNRSTYSVSGAAGPPAPPLPPPPPPPPNQPPTTRNDSGTIEKCALGGNFNVTGNDTDPEGHLPITLTAVTQGSIGIASVLNGSTVHYAPSGSNGSEVLTYTVQDSLGAPSTGTLTIEVVSGSCGGPEQ